MSGHSPIPPRGADGSVPTVITMPRDAVHQEMDDLLHRRTQRTRVGAPVDITILKAPTFPTHNIQLLDSSPGGIGFIASDSFTPGQLFVVHLRCANHPYTMVLYRVRWYGKSKDGTHRLGGTFIDAQAPTPQNAHFPPGWLALSKAVG